MSHSQSRASHARTFGVEVEIVVCRFVGCVLFVNNIRGANAINSWRLTKRCLQSAEKIKAKDKPEGLQPVQHADLLSFLVRAAVIADRHFIDRASKFRNFSGYFDLKTEAAGFDNHVANDFAAKGLVTGFDVGEINVGQ